MSADPVWGLTNSFRQLLLTGVRHGSHTSHHALSQALATCSAEYCPHLLNLYHTGKQQVPDLKLMRANLPHKEL